MLLIKYLLSLMVIKIDAASHWLSGRVGVQLTIFPSEFFTKKEQLRGPLLSPLLLLPAFPAKLLAASRHWGRNSSGTDKWQMTLASNYAEECECSRHGALFSSPCSQPLCPAQCLSLGRYVILRIILMWASISFGNPHPFPFFYYQCLPFLLENHSLTAIKD